MRPSQAFPAHWASGDPQTRRTAVGYIRRTAPGGLHGGWDDTPLRRRDWLTFAREVLSNGLEPTCAKCESTEDVQVDHVVPLSRDGDHHLDNLQLLCGSCNSSKGARHDGPPVQPVTPELASARWLHTFLPDGEVHRQGRIDRVLADGTIVAQLYDWFMGEPSRHERIDLETTPHALYATAKEWREEGDRLRDIVRDRLDQEAGRR